MPLPTRIEKFMRDPVAVHRQGLAGAVRDPHAQALIDVLEPSSQTVDALMRLNLPAGVDIEIKL